MGKSLVIFISHDIRSNFILESLLKFFVLFVFVKLRQSKGNVDRKWLNESLKNMHNNLKTGKLSATPFTPRDRIVNEVNMQNGAWWTKTLGILK